MRGGKVFRPSCFRPPHSLWRQRQARQYPWVDGAGRIGWCARGRSEPRPEVVRRASELYVVAALRPALFCCKGGENPPSSEPEVGFSKAPRHEEGSPPDDPRWNY